MKDKLTLDASQEKPPITLADIPQWLIIATPDGEIRIPLGTRDLDDAVRNFADALDLIRQKYPEAFKILQETGIEWIPKEKEPS